MALELHNKFPIVGNNINLRFEERIIFDNADIVIPLGAKVALTGANGTGKTSLLRMMLDCAEGFTISPKAIIGCHSQSGYQYPLNQEVIAFMREGCGYQEFEIRSVLASMGFGPGDINKLK